MGQVNNFFFFFLNSKLKSKIGCYQIYLLKKKLRNNKDPRKFLFFQQNKVGIQVVSLFS